MSRASDEWYFSTNGTRPIDASTLNDWAQELVQDDINNFILKRTRSGVETALASLKVSGEIRGYLQSHGVSGVQDRHYNAYDFIDEKKEALLKLEKFLTT